MACLGMPPSISKNFLETLPELFELFVGTLGVWLCARRQDSSCFATLRLAERPDHGSFRPARGPPNHTHTYTKYTCSQGFATRESCRKHPVGLWERACVKRKLSKKQQGLDCVPRMSPSFVCIFFSPSLSICSDERQRLADAPEQRLYCQ